ncbi:MAG: ATP-binding protein [Bacteroidales bacterium]|nr:ATP-binding protein [Bacteroidales bacterium]
MELTQEFRVKVAKALLENRKHFTGSDAAFARTHSINNSIYSRLKNGETVKLLSDQQWFTIGKNLGVTLNSRDWKVAATEVFQMIEEEIAFCQEFAKARIFVDDCGIGKTFTAKWMARNRRNCFYVDASQSKTKHRFIKALATAIGVDDKGKYAEIMSNIKYYLHVLPTPLIIIDEAGDLDYAAFLEIKELWNATENVCGWYMMGAEGLRAKIERGINCRKVGYREIFSRYSEKYSSIVPVDRKEKQLFYKKLITDVLTVNAVAQELIPNIVNKCLIQQDGNIGGLRRAESLLILNNMQHG